MRFWYRLGYSTAEALFEGFFHYRVYHRERLRLVENTGALLASNHVSMFDPPLIGIAFDYEVYYLARKTLFNHPFTGFFYPRFNALPVDQERPEMGSLKRIIRLVKAGEKVVVFPEGQRSLDGTILPGEPGVGLMIAKSHVPVVPFRIFGAYEALPRGKKYPQKSHISVVVGEPVKFTEAELAAKNREGYRALAQRVMDEVARLEIPAE
jgi:1-acyl-sn-glycerol-3-phosphate acyltransferase